MQRSMRQIHLAKKMENVHSSSAMRANSTSTIYDLFTKLSLIFLICKLHLCFPRLKLKGYERICLLDGEVSVQCEFACFNVSDLLYDFRFPHFYHASFCFCANEYYAVLILSLYLY